MSCVVDTDGKPVDIEVTKALDPEADEAAVDALKQWEFTPGSIDGKAVRVRITVEMRFALK